VLLVADVDVRVVHGDAVGVSTDLLVLKYAQALYGLDREVARRLGIVERDLPDVGGRFLMRCDGSPAAAAVLFLGVAPLRRFGYEEIRVFGRRAIADAAVEAPDATDVCLTLHGPNYGLDEIEAFNSELAGVIDAITGNAAGAALRTVTFVEKDAGRAERMREVLTSAIPGGSLRAGLAPREAGVVAEAVDRLSTVGFDSAAKEHVFVAMPFSPEFEDVYTFGIVPSVHASNLLVERMDEIPFAGDIVARMRDRISGSRLFVADVTGANPNVYLEIGFAWGNGIPTLLVCRDIDELKFDVRGHRCLSYTNIVELQRKLTKEIAVLLAT
jgi:hypothetical protein